ncbi:TetR/AcrR family transcriptional regulator [Paenibacillus sp. SYP-B3998]|uniref:TetR/AcrR family transcriptional regulator n=1 Tax=Paenibacillus sp. SYP-B3998 TaxID=2678564 RepID=A0A6G4A1P2_9BACL|nr:TetR/AcrR family transcriptional regulator [Paenibacillus sp. SYP-B3998]NEW07741.1 TetR/AcrR family transcriptional regulator [Paenibacillus sp. SYP-B3998]
MNKKQLQSELTKNKIAEAARTLFAQRGYAATSIEDIVAATGSSKGNIYYHFKSKEGLFLHLVDEWDREWKAQWVEKEHLYATVEEKLYGLAEHLVANDLNHPLTKAADEFLSSEWEKSDVQDEVIKYISEHIEFNQRMLQQGIDAGELKSDDTRTLGFILEALLMGLGEMSKRSQIKDAISIYRKAFKVFLYGTVVQKSGRDM